jgi:hypothetical protein
VEHLWPWLALAAAGALHGLNPASGWIFGACVPGAGGRSQALRTVLPIAAGHVGALAVGAVAVPVAIQAGLDIDRLVLPGVVVGLLVVAAHWFSARVRLEPWWRCGRLGVALCSFITSTAHGAGWMLVPAFMPLCATGLPGGAITASGSVLLVLGAAAIHMAAMLATAAAVTFAVRRAFGAGRRWTKRAGAAPDR